MHDPARAALSARPVPNRSSSKFSKAKRKEVRLSKYCGAAKYLISTYESDDIIYQEEVNIVYFHRPSNMDEDTYALTLWEN